MQETKVKKYRGIVRRMMERLSENGKDWAKPRSTAVRAFKSPSCDQMMQPDVSGGRGNMTMESSQSEKEQIQKIDEAENVEASSAFSGAPGMGNN